MGTGRFGVQRGTHAGRTIRLRVCHASCSWCNIHSFMQADHGQWGCRAPAGVQEEQLSNPSGADCVVAQVETHGGCGAQMQHARCAQPTWWQALSGIAAMAQALSGIAAMAQALLTFHDTAAAAHVPSLPSRSTYTLAAQSQAGW